MEYTCKKVRIPTGKLYELKTRPGEFREETMGIKVEKFEVRHVKSGQVFTISIVRKGGKEPHYVDGRDGARIFSKENLISMLRPICPELDIQQAMKDMAG